jgi:hypothetical protein
MKRVMLFLAACVASGCIQATAAEEQTRFFDARGRSTGTSVQISPDSTRFFDERGRSLGTSTTRNGTTTFYDERGRVTGRSGR